MPNFVGGVGVVTGGAHGIGRALAVEAARRGASVMIGDVEDAASTVAEIEGIGGKASWRMCDVGDRADVEALHAATMSTFGGVNLVCSNVSIGAQGPLHLTSSEDFERILRVNVVGSFALLAVFAPELMRAAEARPPSHFLITGSENSLGVPPTELPPYVGQLSAYTFSKQALLGMAAVARRDLAPSGVNVAILCPGWTWNERLRQYADTNERMARILAAYAQTPEYVAACAFEGMVNGAHIIPTNPISRDFVVNTHMEIVRAIEAIPVADFTHPFQL